MIRTRALSRKTRDFSENRINKTKKQTRPRVGVKTVSAPSPRDNENEHRCAQAEESGAMRSYCSVSVIFTHVVVHNVENERNTIASLRRKFSGPNCVSATCKSYRTIERRYSIERRWQHRIRLRYSLRSENVSPRRRAANSRQYDIYTFDPDKLVAGKTKPV